MLPNATVCPGGQVQRAEHQLLGTGPPGMAAVTVLVAVPWHAGQWLPAQQLISCN